jgi:hypothetical protein
VVVLDRVRVDGEGPALGELGGRAQIEHRAQAEGSQALHVGGRETVQTVGPVQQPPPGTAAVGGLVPAEVAEVVYGLQLDQALQRDIAHVE